MWCQIISSVKNLKTGVGRTRVKRNGKIRGVKKKGRKIRGNDLVVEIEYREFIHCLRHSSVITFSYVCCIVCLFSFFPSETNRCRFRKCCSSVWGFGNGKTDLTWAGWVLEKKNIVITFSSKKPQSTISSYAWLHKESYEMPVSFWIRLAAAALLNKVSATLLYLNVLW